MEYIRSSNLFLAVRGTVANVGPVSTDISPIVKVSSRLPSALLRRTPYAVLNGSSCEGS